MGCEPLFNSVLCVPLVPSVPRRRGERPRSSYSLHAGFHDDSGHRTFDSTNNSFDCNHMGRDSSKGWRRPSQKYIKDRKSQRCNHAKVNICMGNDEFRKAGKRLGIILQTILRFARSLTPTISKLCVCRGCSDSTVEDANHMFGIHGSKARIADDLNPDVAS